MDDRSIVPLLLVGGPFDGQYIDGQLSDWGVLLVRRPGGGRVWRYLEADHCRAVYDGPVDGFLRCPRGER